MGILLVTGSTRALSTNTALLRTAALLDPDSTLFDGLAGLPHFDPDADHEPLPEPVARLREAVDAADAVVFCTPEYAGTLPGSFKNLLDWLVGGSEITGKPVAWVGVAADGRRGEGAHDTLRTVLGYVGATVLEPACERIPVPRDAVGPDGSIDDPGVRSQLIALLTTVRNSLSRNA